MVRNSHVFLVSEIHTCSANIPTIASRNMTGLKRLCHCLQSFLWVGEAQGVEQSLVQDLWVNGLGILPRIWTHEFMMINVDKATLKHPQTISLLKKHKQICPDNSDPSNVGKIWFVCGCLVFGVTCEFPMGCTCGLEEYESMLVKQSCLPTLRQDPTYGFPVNWNENWKGLCFQKMIFA